MNLRAQAYQNLNDKLTIALFDSIGGMAGDEIIKRLNVKEHDNIVDFYLDGRLIVSANYNFTIWS